MANFLTDLLTNNLIVAMLKEVFSSAQIAEPKTNLDKLEVAGEHSKLPQLTISSVPAAALAPEQIIIDEMPIEKEPTKKWLEENRLPYPSELRERYQVGDREPWTPER